MTRPPSEAASPRILARVRSDGVLGLKPDLPAQRSGRQVQSVEVVVPRPGIDGVADDCGRRGDRVGCREEPGSGAGSARTSWSVWCGRGTCAGRRGRKSASPRGWAQPARRRGCPPRRSRRSVPLRRSRPAPPPRSPPTRSSRPMQRLGAHSGRAADVSLTGRTDLSRSQRWRACPRTARGPAPGSRRGPTTGRRSSPTGRDIACAPVRTPSRWSGSRNRPPP